jgi:hypothetical protein
VNLPWKILAVVMALAGAFAAGDYHGHRTERTTWHAKVEQARADASEAARQIERKRQEAANAATQKQINELGSINAGLIADIDGLRNRPPRIVRVPAPASPDCAGSTGRELSAEDAGFLVRLAADADRHRAALAACYAYADAVIEPWKNQNPKN